MCRSEKTGYQTFTETIFSRLPDLSLVLCISPAHLSFRSHGSFSLIWIPTVFCITDSASIKVKHMPFSVLTVSWWWSVCVELPGVPRPPPNPPHNPSKMSESLWKYSVAPHCGTAAKTEPRISIYFNCSLVWNTTAGEHEGNSAPLLPTLTSFFWGEGVWWEVERGSNDIEWRGQNTLHNSGAPTFQERFGSFRILSLWSSMVCMLFPLVRFWAVWPSASLHSPSLWSSFTLSLSLPPQKRQIWRRSAEPTRAKMSRSKVDELIYFQQALFTSSS